MDRTPPLAAIAAAIRRERERLGISSAELARRAGIAKSTLSQLEAGTGNPSVETLWAIAVVADVPFSTLVEPPSSPVRVVRAADRPSIRSQDSPFAGALLSACPPGARRDVHMITSEPGEPREAHAHSPGTIEHMVVATGRWVAGPDGEEIELDPGDYITFPADRPHRYRALDPGAAAVLIMEYR
ncbi:helix-turn-helix domain-containing protein [Pseudonocardia sp. HH130630-07]|uniref:helix-turn-helix domain-containing protein n=1 Tax=Pseudonocardia sp. HH130630-07 TaxID=1690815 RepID=UPI000814BB87|nr:helix-turn-helix domain-containing protein [Pseudonocardia sp. HH130630-07]ANY09557.1 DNA-binding protein [Pseudonocardia sp. HH130630-07]